jgi:hypothetical protein
MSPSPGAGESSNKGDGVHGAGEREAVKVEARRQHDRGRQFGVIAGITASEHPVELTLR